MTRYELAKLVTWAGTLYSRKRLQKVVFLLQAARCPLEADFFLHNYGPYSEEVARLTDEMVREKLLEETMTGSRPHEQYNYQLTESTQRQLSEFESSPQGASMKNALSAFEAKARSLLAANLKQLEHAATIAYFQRLGHDWSEAVDKAVTFKKDEAVRSALPLAQEALAGRRRERPCRRRSSVIRCTTTSGSTCHVTSGFSNCSNALRCSDCDAFTNLASVT